MPIETASFLADLQPDWPLGSDPESAGDDHLRLVKQVLQNTFPNISGAVTGGQDGLNNITSMLQYSTNSERHWTLYQNAADGSTTDGPGQLALLGLTTAEQWSTNRNYALNGNTLSMMLYPVGAVIFNTGKNPADYLGFGTWTARAGAIYGVGTVSGSDGESVTFPSGVVAGHFRVHDEHIQAFTASGATTTDGQHQHTVPCGGKAHGQGYNTENEDYAGTGSQTTNSDTGNHNHDVDVTVGKSSQSFYNTGFAFYVWERTA